MPSPGIGAKLRQERIGRGLTIDDIARETKIAPRYLEAIEADQFDRLPGLLFTRNFVRQFAQTLKMDPDPLVVALPGLDESMICLPDPPARARSSYDTDRRIHSAIWLVIAVAAAIGAWHFNHAGPRDAAASPTVVRTALAAPPAPISARPPNVAAAPVSAVADKTPNAAVQVVLTAHEPTWVQVSADGKAAFTGTLQPNETKEISAAQQVKLVSGNAGGLTVSLNGKTLEALGPSGQVRVVTLTAEGPEFLEKAPRPALDPL